MKCPHCKYEHSGYDFEKKEAVEGNHGDFFQLPIKMVRSLMWGQDEENHLYACPSCGVAFIEVHHI